ncbi:MAG TPA: beta-ketoacyl-[acyl-carrier-protein] synthase family protein [Vicinamibacterales bacterium]|jgi:3-oxoacyl-[acyl-carrier-protein] synthase II
MTKRRVAITGIGLLCALGLDRESAWERLCDGRCGISDLTLFDGAGYRSRKVAEVPAWDAPAHFSPNERRRYSRSDQLAVLAAQEALADSGLLERGTDRAAIGVVFGAGTNDLLRHETYYKDVRALGHRRARPSNVFNYFNDAQVDTVARRFGLGGLRACPLSACSSSAVAVGYAADLVAAGHLDAALCGGSDALCRLTLGGFNALRLVDVEPCRPFDTSRNGMNIGEAGAVLVLEEFERARARGTHVYAELAGYAACCEAHHPTAPEPEGLAVAALLRAALAAAGVAAADIDHVNTHGTATPQNDRAESRGLRAVFGERTGAIPVTSTKSMVGHCLGAAGAVEAAILAMTIDRGLIPPTVNHRQTDPECPVSVVANQARAVEVTCGISTSLAFGGNDVALVVKRAS